VTRGSCWTRRACLVLAAFWATTSAVWAQSACGSIDNRVGPFDYRTQRAQLKIVEEYHFTPGVEALTRGQSSTNVAGDLSYLMRASPNHHRGLVSIMRLVERSKSPQPTGLQFSIECYFERAIRFRSDDTVVRALFAQYLHKQRRTAEALAQLDAAAVLAEDKPMSQFNLGLVYFDIGEYDRALVQAHRARSQGHDVSVLADRLKSVNKWREQP
jgi:tetratricopeptide (TPR) repeat protein